MATPEELGARIKAARLAKNLGVKNAAEQAGVARDTWYRIEAGKPGQDTKLHIALAFFDLDTNGLPAGSADEYVPVTYDTLDARLANYDRQIDALWRRLDELGAGRGPDRQDDLAPVTPFRPRDEPTPHPAAGAPPIPDDLAADDPGEPTEAQRQDERDRDDNEGR